MRQGAGTCTTTCTAITSQAQTVAIFDATTANNPATVSWSVDGRPAATCPPATSGCTGSGNAWTFNWALGTVPKDTTSGSVNLGFCVPGAYVLDGVYQVGLQAFDGSAASGGAASLSIAVNRCPGLAPPGLDATGRNVSGPVDVDWESSSEGDIVGYRVYRGTSNTSRTPVCPPVISAGQVTALDAATECLDASAPSYVASTLYYGVYSVDRDGSGALREGALAFVNVNTGNKPPIVANGMAAAKDAAGAVTLTWTVPNTQDPDTGDSIRSFRVYRRSGATTTSPALTDRYDRDLLTALCTGSTCQWKDPAPQAAVTAYWLTSVDTHLRESGYTPGKTA
jgi:hypothetical protein